MEEGEDEEDEGDNEQDADDDENDAILEEDEDEADGSGNESGSEGSEYDKHGKTMGEPKFICQECQQNAVQNQKDNLMTKWLKNNFDPRWVPYFSESRNYKMKSRKYFRFMMAYLVLFYVYTNVPQLHLILF